MAVEAHPKLTYADYAALPDDGRRWEIVDGEAHVTPAPNIRHQRLVRRLLVAFENHLEANGGGEVFDAPCDVVLSGDQVVQPDLVFIATADSERITDANIHGPPTLLVEVLSDPYHDRVRKRALYARFAVPQYWIVDPSADRVEVYRLGDGTYGTAEVYPAGAMLPYERLPGLLIDVARLFRAP